MVSTADPLNPRRGVTRLGRIEARARFPHVEPPPVKGPARRRMVRWASVGAVLAGIAGLLWLMNSRVIAFALVEGRALTLQAPADVLVEEVLVAPGEWCEEGRPLVRLAPLEPDPARSVLESYLAQARLRLALAERGGELHDLQLTRRFDERDRLAAEAESAMAAMRAAEARRDFAQKELLRQKELQAHGHYSTREVHEAERDARVAESGVAEAQAVLEGARLRGARQRLIAPPASDGSDLHRLELELLRASVQEAEERLAEFDHRAGRRELVAPLAGRVDRVFVQDGSAAGSGEPLLTLYDPRSLYPLAYVSPDDVDRFPVGAAVRLYAERRGRPVLGSVEIVHDAWTSIPPVLQRAYGERRTAVPVRLVCPAEQQERLVPGMVLRVVADRR